MRFLSLSQPDHVLHMISPNMFTFDASKLVIIFGKACMKMLASMLRKANLEEATVDLFVRVIETQIYAVETLESEVMALNDDEEEED